MFNQPGFVYGQGDIGDLLSGPGVGMDLGEEKTGETKIMGAVGAVFGGRSSPGQPPENTGGGTFSRMTAAGKKEK